MDATLRLRKDEILLSYSRDRELIEDKKLVQSLWKEAEDAEPTILSDERKNVIFSLLSIAIAQRYTIALSQLYSQ